MNKTKTVVVVSGGMDSTTLAYDLKAQGHELTLISFDYGQRHAIELWYASQHAEKLDAKHHIVDLTCLTSLMNKSSLTNKDIEVPDGHYAHETMKQTVVPNRNAIMLNIACGLAVSIGAQNIATGVHGGDHYIYPDCRPEFIGITQNMFMIANEGFIHPEFQLLAPYLHKTKADIAKIGNDLGVEWQMTWSCYKGLDKHCGACGTCFERREAFELAGISDPTDYLTTPNYDDPRN